MPYHDIDDGRLVWLLQVQYAGQVYRWASEAIDVLTSAGERIAYEGGLQVELDEELGLFDEAPTPNSVSFRGLPMRDDLPLYAARGATFLGNPGELALLRVGDVFEQRFVRVDGIVRGAEYGVYPAPLAFTLEGRPLDEDARILDARAKVTEETWPNAPSRNIGRYYPFPFGQPGIFRMTAGNVGKTNGSPAVKVDTITHTAIIADGRVESSTVRIISADQGNPAVAARTFTVFEAADSLGRIVSAVDLSSSAVPLFEDGEEFYVRWDDGNATLDHDGNAIVGAGDLTRHILAKTRTGIDLGAVEAARPWLNQIRLSGYIDDGEVQTWAWVFRQVSPLLLVSWVRGAKGLAPVWWDPDAIERDAQFSLEDGRNCFIDADTISEPSVQPVNEIELGFAVQADNGQHRRRLLITGDPDPAYESRLADVFSTTYSRASLANFGPGFASLTTEVLYEEASAAIVLERLVKVRGFLWQDYEAELDLEDWRIREREPPRLGTQGVLTSSKFHLSAVPVVLIGLSWQNDRVLARLVRIPDFLREIEPAG